MKTNSFRLTLAGFLWAMITPLAYSEQNAEESLEESAAVITECDIQAAHPSDPNHVGEGKLTEDVDTDKAIPACQQAVKQSPSTPRFHYQLGRALVYSGNFEEGKMHVKHAADMGHMQAQFVLALLSRAEPCEGEKLIKTAADQGLKSARITYVNDFLSGVYADCEISASTDEMSAYLKAAGAQMNGYYETMLLNNLLNQFSIQD